MLKQNNKYTKFYNTYWMSVYFLHNSWDLFPLFEQIFHRDVLSHEPEIRDILDKGHSLLDDDSSDSSRKQLAEKLHILQADWNELKDKSKSRQDQLDSSLKHGQKYHDNLNKMLLWLQTTEDKLDSSPATMDKFGIAKKLKDAQV